jgi:anthranilate phosphoribosyltransferase
MQELIKEVARGKRGSQDLTYEQAKRAADLILTEEAKPVQVGAFLVAERLKMETTEELLGFVHALEARSFKHPLAGGIDCAGPYTGRSRTFAATLPTAFVLTSLGLPVTLHASPALPPKMGVTLLDILSALQLPIERINREQLTKAADQKGLMFVPTEKWCPSLETIRPLRADLGVRTLFNTAEKLIRFTEAPYIALGVFHGTVFEKVAELLVQLGVQRGLVIQGVEGSEDLTVEKRTRTLFVHQETHKLLVIDPDELGLQANFPEVEWTAELQAQTTLAVLQNEAHTAYRNMVLLNSGVRIWLAQKSESIEEGVEQARTALESGAAWNQFEQWSEMLDARGRGNST